MKKLAAIVLLLLTFTLCQQISWGCTRDCTVYNACRAFSEGSRCIEPEGCICNRFFFGKSNLGNNDEIFDLAEFNKKLDYKTKLIEKISGFFQQIQEIEDEEEKVSFLNFIRAMKHISEEDESRPRYPKLYSRFKRGPKNFGRAEHKRRPRIVCNRNGISCKSRAARHLEADSDKISVNRRIPKGLNRRTFRSSLNKLLKGIVKRKPSKPKGNHESPELSYAIKNGHGKKNLKGTTKKNSASSINNENTVEIPFKRRRRPKNTRASKHSKDDDKRLPNTKELEKLFKSNGKTSKLGFGIGLAFDCTKYHVCKVQSLKNPSLKCSKPAFECKDFF